MRIILRAHVKRLGGPGDVVDVKDGYARNYLIPYGYAYPFSEENVRRVEAEKKRMQERYQMHLSKMGQLKEALETTSLSIAVRATEDGKLFGSVTAATIASELKERGYPVEEHMIELEAHIKELGVYEVPIRLAEGIEARLRLWVVEQEAETEEKEETAETEES